MNVLPKLSVEQAFHLSRDLLYFPYKMKNSQWTGRVMYHKSINEKYGTRKGAEFLISTGLFEPTRWDSKRKIARAWSLTTFGEEVLRQFYNEESPGEIIQFSSGKRRKSRAPKRAIERLSKSGSRPPNLEYLELHPSIDKESLVRGREKLHTELKIVRSEKEKNKLESDISQASGLLSNCLLYTSPSPRDRTRSRMPSSA